MPTTAQLPGILSGWKSLEVLNPMQMTNGKESVSCTGSTQKDSTLPLSNFCDTSKVSETIELPFPLLRRTFCSVLVSWLVVRTSGDAERT